MSKINLVVLGLAVLLSGQTCETSSDTTPQGKPYTPDASKSVVTPFNDPEIVAWVEAQRVRDTERHAKEGTAYNDIVYFYTGVTSDPFNGYLRGTYTEADFKASKNFPATSGDYLREYAKTHSLADFIKSFDEIIEHAPQVPKTVIFYRGVNNVYKNFEAGDLLTDPAYISATSSEGDAAKYALFGFPAAAFDKELPSLDPSKTYCCMIQARVGPNGNGFYLNKQLVLPSSSYFGVRSVDYQWTTFDPGTAKYDGEKRLCIRTITLDHLGSSKYGNVSAAIDKSRATSLAGITGDPGRVFADTVMCR